MNLEEILEQLDDVRVRLLEALVPLPDVVLAQPRAIGEWSLADVLAHFVNWEAEMVTALHQINQGKKPTRLLQALADRDAYNQQRYPEFRGRDLDRIFDDLQGVRSQLEGWLEEFGDRDLKEPDRFPGLKNKPLWKLIAETSFEHEASHIPEIEAFVNAWLAKNQSAIAPGDDEVNENGDRP